MADQDEPLHVRTFSFPEDFDMLDFIYQQTANVACDREETDLLSDLMAHLDFSTFVVMAVIAERLDIPFEETLAQHCENVRKHFNENVGKDSDSPKPH